MFFSQAFLITNPDVRELAGQTLMPETVVAARGFPEHAAIAGKSRVQLA
jgi:hypothetical protein